MTKCVCVCVSLREFLQICQLLNQQLQTYQININCCHLNFSLQFLRRRSLHTRICFVLHFSLQPFLLKCKLRLRLSLLIALIYLFVYYIVLLFNLFNLVLFLFCNFYKLFRYKFLLYDDDHAFFHKIFVLFFFCFCFWVHI